MITLSLMPRETSDQAFFALKKLPVNCLSSMNFDVISLLIRRGVFKTAIGYLLDEFKEKQTESLLHNGIVSTNITGDEH